MSAHQYQHVQFAFYYSPYLLFFLAGVVMPVAELLPSAILDSSFFQCPQKFSVTLLWPKVYHHFCLLNCTL